ncbi:MAG: ParA family protein [Gemmataceae bacterium]
MKVVSVINYKGGVGKTTVTANLGAALAQGGKKVLLIDVDPQASLTFSFVDPATWHQQLADRHTIKRWFDAIDQGNAESLDELCLSLPAIDSRVSNGGELNLIASHLGLINVDLNLATQLGGGNLNQIKNNYIKIHGRLASALQQMAGDFDFILIDCPPNFNIVTKNAIVASDHILIPARPDYLSTLGIDYLHRSVRELVEEYNEMTRGMAGVERLGPGMLGVVFTMVQFNAREPIMAQKAFIDQVRQMPDIPVFDTYIRMNNSKFAEAAQDGVPYVLSRDSDPTGKTIIAELKQMTQEFLARLN